MPVVFFAPNGEPVQSDVVKSGVFSIGSYIKRTFSNDRVQLRLACVLSLHVHPGVPKEHYKPWLVTVENIIHDDPVDGSFLPEPNIVKDIDATRSFRTQQEAEKHYNDFLAKYTDSHYDPETGELREVGNKLAPPDPDKPTISEDSPVADEFGSW